MTNEEAIQILQRLNPLSSASRPLPEEAILAIELAIEALSVKLPQRLDEAAENCTYCEHAYARESFREGAEWMAGQGVIIEGRIAEGHREGYPALCLPTNMDNRYSAFKPGDKVVVQIRKK